MHFMSETVIRMGSHAIKVKENGHSKNAFPWRYTLFLLIIIRFKTILRNISYVMNGVEVLKYSGKLLPLNEMDERYPPSEWLQTFLDKNITIENLHDYCRYLNARDMLIRIQKKPQVWTSGLFDIPPTENWETYEETYINQLTNPEKAPHA